MRGVCVGMDAFNVVVLFMKPIVVLIKGILCCSYCWHTTNDDVINNAMDCQQM